MSLLETKCPLCKGSLWIDPATSRIVDHRPADYQKPSLEQFIKDSKQDKGWDEKMKKAREDEARRKAEIEAKFKQAVKEGADPGDASLRPNIQWD